jgi:hypothetical protein
LQVLSRAFNIFNTGPPHLLIWLLDPPSTTQSTVEFSPPPKVALRDRGAPPQAREATPAAACRDVRLHAHAHIPVLCAP